VSGEVSGPGVLVGDRYYILASSVAADLPKLTLKRGDAFLVADRRGDFPGLPRSEFGFYVDGTRFLQRLELHVHQEQPLFLNATTSNEAVEAMIDLTNPDIVVDGGLRLPGRALRIARRLVLDLDRLCHTLLIESFARQPYELTLGWRFAADFVDVFEVRGHRRPRRGERLPPRAEDAALELAYRGLDGVRRTTRLVFDPAPDRLDDTGAEYRLVLTPGQRLELRLTVAALLGEAAPRAAVKPCVVPTEPLLADPAVLRTDHELVNQWIERSRNDLEMLLTETPEGLVPYAGIPWYVAPFGRDSLITALQTLPIAPAIARGVLRFLARHQGTVDDPFTDQEPGKILHEYRRGELAACREIPFIPYYGSVDATPLFLVTLAEYLRWTGDLALARELWPAAERALGWLAQATQDDGYLRYQRRSPLGLEHQGWKDSRDAVMHASGEPAKPPIALVEVQGYLYAAWLGAAEVAEQVGRPELAPGLRERAARLRERFERDFWMEDLAFYALALDGRDEPCRVITSNPGHCLWTGIVDRTRAAAVARRLMADDVFTGWGLRTLGARERLYNPMSYHNGSVWPHDTAIAALGMRRYGLVEPFERLATALFEAVLYFDGGRMPELFCGFPRAPGQGPTRYPVACSPQAWSAGVVFQLLGGMLGLVPEAHENRLTLVQPRLPAWLEWLELRGVRIGTSRLSLHLGRGREFAAIELIAREGDAELVVRR